MKTKKDVVLLVGAWVVWMRVVNSTTADPWEPVEGYPAYEQCVQAANRLAKMATESQARQGKP
jgi:hypothetical protein